MSRFKTLRKHLSFSEALSVYLKVKYSNSRQLQLKKISTPFSLRDNPYDYATFEEVLLREEYAINLNFTPATIIDAGGNIGLTALFFANRFPSSSIISLEPDTENFTLLSSNVLAYKNITAIHCGLWSKDAYLQVIDQGKGNNAFTVKETTAQAKDAIKAICIETIMQQQQWKQIDILKIDIEGSEKEVFQNGYASWLPKVKVLIIELHDRMVPGASKAVFSAIDQYDFSMDIKGENLVFTNNNPNF